MRHTLLFLLFLFLTGCWGNEGTILGYELIEAGDDFGGLGNDEQSQGIAYEGDEPNFLVITKVEEVTVPGLGVRFSPDIRTKLEQVNYDQFYVVAIFYGIAPNIGLDNFIVVENIFYDTQNSVTIVADFNEPREGDVMQEAVGAPYYIVKVDKRSHSNRDINFSLLTENKVIQGYQVHIP